ncbi:hypothetical protein WR25_15314 [Diploscapter pachys]|uniref:Rho-GAP domain-containing protein n=1 Tax=Diploscapter pachys TaxID=2018661 RepID=A0A2A2M160_9BILA|nr:hypothetical protein WR25_15314 [Diploscapter pachys]
MMHLQAECRARMGEAGGRNSSILTESPSPMDVNVNGAKEENLHEPEEHSNVRNIVASLIKSIEENRYKADDTPTLLNIEQETATQTSPFSISRSSSFDWINEPTEGRLRDIRTPSEPSKTTEFLRRDRNDWSSENDEADREVAAVIEKSKGKETPKECEKEKLLRKMDESLALLLECSESAQNGNTKGPSASSSLTRNSNWPNNLNGNDMVRHSSTGQLTQTDILSPPVPPRSFRNLPPLGRMKGIDSIYDNMPGRRKLKLDDLGSSTSSPSTDRSIRSANMNMAAKESPYSENGNLNESEVAPLSLTVLPLADVDTNISIKMKDAENDALEACRWLKQAGFPQYVKQYEEGNFPIELHSVNKDHAFLGTDSLRALYRRLDTLNRCAIMKIDNVIMRRRNDFDVFGLDDEDNVALSSNWQYQRQNHTWSRIGNEPMYGATGRIVSTKPNWQMDRHQISPYDKRADGRTERYEDGKMDGVSASSVSSANGSIVAPPDGPPSPQSAAAFAQAKLSRSQSERIKERARAIMKKMDLRSSSRRRASRARDATNPLVIGDPVLLSFDSHNQANASANLNPAAISSGSGRSIPRPSDLSVRSRPIGPSERQSRSKSARRQGMVILSPTHNHQQELISPAPTQASAYAFSPPPSHSHRIPVKRDRSVPPPTAYHTRSNSSYNRGFVPSSPPPGHFTPQLNGYGHLGGRFSSTNNDSSSPYVTGITPMTPSMDRYRFDPRTLLERHNHNQQQGGSLPRWTSRPVQPAPAGPLRTSPYCYTPSASTSTTHSPAASVATSIHTTPYSPPYYSSYFHPASTQPQSQSIERSRNLVIQDDGYYLHDVSSDSSLLRTAASESPSTSNGEGHLKVDTAANKSQGSLTDDEQLGGTAFVQSRRDSGVGSSLSRSPSGPSSLRIRQSIFPSSSFPLKSHPTSSLPSAFLYRSPPTLPSYSLPSSTSSAVSASSASPSEEAFFSDLQLAHCIDSLSVIDVLRIRKLAYLRVTGILERCMGVGVMRNIDMNVEQNGGRQQGNGHSTGHWTYKLMQRIKQIDAKSKGEPDENGVFGASLDVSYKRWGTCLPKPILEVIAFLRQMAPDTVGLFRKNGVKSRIAELREVCERGDDAFTEETKLHSSQVHDVADMLKQYLRELPEPLMTCRLSEVFINIFMHVPENERFNALQYAIFLLPDENREALQTLLFFLHDVAKYSQVNNMPPQNLAVCFAPSLFHMTASRLDKVSGSRRHKTIGAAGMPTEREMRETRACQLCLTAMIDNPRQLFTLPEGTIEERSHEEDIPPLKELGLKSARSYLIDKVLDLVKDHDERWKNWTPESSYEGIEICSKKNLDEHPLKTWKVCIWDSSVVNWRHVEMVHTPDTDIHQYVLNDTVGHPSRDCHLVRFHRADITEIRGSCAIAERSVACSDKQLLGGLQAAVLDQRFLIEPKSGVSRVTYIARVDLRGRSTAWYNRSYGPLMARQMIRLRDSFQPHSSPDDGPETKV